MCAMDFRARLYIYYIFFLLSNKHRKDWKQHTKKEIFCSSCSCVLLVARQKEKKKSRNQNKATTIQSHDWWFVSRQNSIHTHNTHTHTCVDEKEPSSYNPSKSNVGRTWKSSFFIIIIIIIHFSSAHTHKVFFCFNID